MKKILFIALLAISGIFAQQNNTDAQTSIEVGNELIIGQPSNQEFEHFHFPKTNFIIKKGGIANYKALAGKKVIVTAVESNGEGKKVVTVKRKDGLKFFKSIATVKIDLEQAISSGEIKS